MGGVWLFSVQRSCEEDDPNHLGVQERCNMLGKHHITFNVGKVYQSWQPSGDWLQLVFTGVVAIMRMSNLGYQTKLVSKASIEDIYSRVQDKSDAYPHAIHLTVGTPRGKPKLRDI